MNLIIYHPNSFGGTYDYAIQIFEAYRQHPAVSRCVLLLPENAAYSGENVHKILPTDLVEGSKWYKKLHFIYRSFANPLKLWAYLRGQKQQKSVVIFDEFEQITSFFWSPFFRATKPAAHRYAVVLHDPDRDAYPPTPAIAKRSMKWVMDAMDFGIYHELLPNRIYYKSNPNVQYINSHLGIYPPFAPNPALLADLQKQKADSQLAVIIGNIRAEKNYDLAIKSLPDFPNLKLLVAGRAANSGMDTGIYKRLAAELGVSDRVLWIERFLSDEDLAAVIQASDLVLLNYSATFKSQSGALCLIAPYKKKLLASAGESALAIAVENFEIGSLAQPDDLTSMKQQLAALLAQSQAPVQQWEHFLQESSWESNAEKAISVFAKSF